MAKKLTPCPDHKYCFDKCDKCGHCDTSYCDDKDLVCECGECECNPMDEVDAFLEHYGVKGMKWGVAK